MSEIVKLLSQVMAEVGAVRKGDRNNQQNFSFRGIDAVTNAVSPALRKAGVIVTPQVIDYQYGSVTVGSKGTVMGHVKVMVRYTFHAPDGSSLETIVPAESFDSGDKATAKAMSVAFRTCLLQTLCLPTDDVDPDATSYERAPSKAAPTHPAMQARQDDAPVVPISGNSASVKQVGAIKALLRGVGLEGDAAKTFIESTIGHAVGSVSELGSREASKVIEALKEAKGEE
jgi:hypothetical protein